MTVLIVEHDLDVVFRLAGRVTVLHLGKVLASGPPEAMPRLAERRGNRGDQLSGGEQQMLAIGRALLRNPRLLLLDEPSDGLAPAVVDQVAEVLEGLRAEGIAAVLVEQDLHLAFADDVAVMQKGRIVHRSPTTDFRRDRNRAHALLGVG